MRMVWYFVVVGLVGAAAGLATGPLWVFRLMPDAGTHGPWYASRAAGLASYLCIWYSLVGGLLMSSAWFDGIVGRARLLALHQTAGIAGVALGTAHALLLIPDGWTEFGLKDLFVPFASYYEPALSGLGTTSLYLSVVVTASFWFRSRIGVTTWRVIHYTSFVAFFGALWHGLQLGTDADRAWVLAIYLVTSLSLVTGLVIRATYVRPLRSRERAAAAAVPGTG